MKIFVTQRIPRAGLDMLSQAYPGFAINSQDRILERFELLEKVKGANGILTLLTDRIDADVFDAAGPALKIVANMAVGFDNIDMAKEVTPALTTVHVYKTWLGIFGVRQLIARALNPEQPKTTTSIMTDLVVRESTSYPGKRST